MSIKVRREREEALKAILANLAEHVEAARTATNTRDTRQALNACWYLLHDAQQTNNEAEREAREDAEAESRRRHAETLAKLTGEAA